MRAFTKSDTIYGASALVADNDVAATLEPATGAISLVAASYEDFVAEVSFNNLVATAGSVSFQFYQKDTNDGDISATWTAVGTAIVDALAASVGDVAFAKKNRLSFTKKYVSVIAAVTFADQGAATYAALSLRGETINVERGSFDISVGAVP